MDGVSLAITILCNGSIKTDTMSSLLDNFNQLPIQKKIGFIIGGYPAYSRNLAVENARKFKLSHLMFIDGDHIFPPDGIKKLIEQKKDIIGANYNQRGLPLISTVKMMNDKGEQIGSRDVATRTPIPDNPFKVYALGMGFCLIDMKVFEKIPQPWFNTEVWVENGETKYKTEDVYFCEQARKSGFDVWCDPQLKVLHIGDYTF